jgi:hypothetical protein
VLFQLFASSSFAAAFKVEVQLGDSGHVVELSKHSAERDLLDF